MKTLIAIVLAVVLSGCSTKQLYYTSIPLTVGDWAQTRNDLVDLGETNPILGDNPSSSTIDLYFAGWILINTAVYKLAPGKVSKPYFYIFNLVQAATIYENSRKGVGFRF